jgi:hypothetical protein
MVLETVPVRGIHGTQIQYPAETPTVIQTRLDSVVLPRARGFCVAFSTLSRTSLYRLYGTEEEVTPHLDAEANLIPRVGLELRDPGRRWLSRSPANSAKA